jgi:hypothetical protein
MLLCCSSSGIRVRQHSPARDTSRRVTSADMRRPICSTQPHQKPPGRHAPPYGHRQGLAAAAGFDGKVRILSGYLAPTNAADRSRWGDRRHRRRVRADWPGTSALCAACPATSVAHALHARSATSPARSATSTGASVARAQARAHLWRVRPGNGGAGDAQQ